MSGSSSEERTTPTGTTAESVVLQYHQPDGAHTPLLTTADLSARELADSLWLAAAIARDDGLVHDDPVEPTAPTDTPVLPPQGDGPDDVEGEPPAEVQEDWELRHRRWMRQTTIDPDPPEVTAPLVWPTVPALPNPLLIGRALRPVAITEDSPWHRELDEEATAAAAAETGLWLPRWQPAPWRRFEVALVVDTSLSMEIWQHTVREFRDVLIRQGAFRDVRTYLLDCSMPVAEKLVLRTAAGAARGWRDLLDPTHRRLVLVMTDTVGTAWHSGAAGRLLAGWGKSMPLAVVQTMPERLWHWGGLAPRRMRLSACEPGVPNRRLVVAPAEPALGPAPRPGATDVVIPVLALDDTWLHNWARLFAVAGAGPVPLTAVFASPDDETDTDVAT
ncbi:MAG TPA: SAV_2336 N-terminal domain-related protein, partial [Pseudonocardiaceae bacterium]